MWDEWHSSEPPDWAWAAYYADEVYYVGGTGNLTKRVREHIDPDGARIEAAFPPWKVESATTTPNRTAAIEYEEKRAEELRSKNDDSVFVYQA
jgi:predicted GIY-YIG superfamily endonuclease